MDFRELMQSGRFTSPAKTPVSTVKKDDEKREAFTPPYVSGEADARKIETADVYLPYGKEYVARYGVEITINLEQALLLRSQGRFVVTLREADIAARCKVPLESEFIRKGLAAIGGMFVEGIPGEKDNPYALRNHYNRGIKFKNSSDYAKSSIAKQERATAELKATLDKLAERHLPAWPEEVIEGFRTELCKPEFMDWHQYEQAASRPVKLHQTSFIQEPTDESGQPSEHTDDTNPD
jgi:hypothetical protein